MKSVMRFAIAALLFASVTAPALGADKKRQQKADDGTNARGLFNRKTSDGLNILVLKYDEGNQTPVAPDTEFKPGDQIKLQVKSNFDGFIYVVNIHPDGKRCLMFPSPEAMDNTVRADEMYYLPPGQVMEFDQEKGTEVLQVIMTRGRIKYLDDALKESEGCLAQSASSAAAELQPGISSKNVAPIVQPGAGDKSRSRDITYAAGKNKDKNGSVVAITDNGAGGKLKQGETAEFQIRLKHN